MQDYSSEQEQIEAIKKWWSENGLAVVLGVAVGLGGLAGWQAWQNHLDTRAEEASMRYMEVTGALEERAVERLEAMVDTLVEDYAPTPYAPLGAFASASMAASDNDLETAEKRLQWIIENSRQEEFVPMARLRLARLYLTAGKPEPAGALIERKDYPEAYAARRSELQGDLYAARSEFAGARSAYDLALSSQPPPRNRQMIQIKRDNLPAVETPGEPGEVSDEAPAGESAADA